jgi:SRP40, C-terminal domain
MVQGAHQDDYGARANRDLIVTRGDGFRKEKNKKKRGSYRGGDITVSLPSNSVDGCDLINITYLQLHSHSFKFED